MDRNTEWELVNESRRPHRPGLRQVLKALLSSPWRWKLIGGVLVAGVVTAIVAIVAGVALLALAAAAAVTVGVLKCKRWLRGNRRTSVMRPY